MKNEKNYMGFLIHKLQQILKRFAGTFCWAQNSYLWRVSWNFVIKAWTKLRCHFARKFPLVCKCKTKDVFSQQQTTEYDTGFKFKCLKWAQYMNFKQKSLLRLAIQICSNELVKYFGASFHCHIISARHNSKIFPNLNFPLF